MQNREFSPSIPGSYGVIQVDDAQSWAVNFTTPPSGHRRGGSTIVAYHLSETEAKALAKSLQASLDRQKRKFN